VSRGGTPVGQLMNIVVDCPDADISARFWAAVLGWERVQENADFVDIADASDGRRRLVFQQIVLEDETYRVYADPAGHPFCLVQLETT
jgi:hypothetical protein